jgi:uncharacterized protein (TIGR02147 family)
MKPTTFQNKLPSVFDYSSFRKWMKDYVEAYKGIDSSFSYRAAARKFGFASPNYLQQVIDGKRNLGEKSIAMISNACKIGKKASCYFSLLVHFAQAEDFADKNRLFSEIIRSKTHSSVMKIIADQLEYYNEWYHCVVRELVAGVKMDSMDFAAVARRVYPAILPKQVKKSIKLLLKHGFIRINDAGTLEQASPLISTDRETQSIVIRNFHRKMLDIARDSLATVPPEKREISSITMKISGAGFDRVKRRIQDFKEELMQIIKEDENTDRVYQANFTLFPLSNPAKPENKETIIVGFAG